MRRRRAMYVVPPAPAPAPAAVAPASALASALAFAFASALLLSHCGGDGDTLAAGAELPERVSASDAGSDALATVEVDAGGAAAQCDPARPFGAPIKVPGLDPMAFAATPRLAHDELTIYFTSMDGASPNARLTRAVRGTRSDAFGTPAILAAQTAPAASDHDPAVSADGLSLWFHSSRSGSLDLFSATRPTRSDDFGAPAPVAELATADSEAHPYYRQAAGELWFVADKGAASGTGFDIYVASRAGAAFGVPTLVAELSSPSDDWQPMVTEDGKTAVFASTRPGGPGKFDLWLARRSSATGAFSPPEPLTELSSPEQEFSGWLSADGCRIWFSSDRDAPGVRQNLYVAERPR